MLLNIKEATFLIIIFIANIMEGITGFAGTMLAMPPSIFLMGVGVAKSVLNIVAIIVSSIILLGTYKNINKKELIKIVCFMLIGIMVGLYLFTVIPITGLVKIYGLLILLVAIKGLFFKKNIELPDKYLILILIMAGIIHGMFLTGGSLLVVYAVSVLKDKSTTRATLAPVWIILNLVMLLQDIYKGNITTEVVKLSIYCIIPVILAVSIGNYLHDKIDQSIFEKLTYILLIISGLTLIF